MKKDKQIRKIGGLQKLLYLILALSIPGIGAGILNSCEKPVDCQANPDHPDCPAVVKPTPINPGDTNKPDTIPDGPKNPYDAALRAAMADSAAMRNRFRNNPNGYNIVDSAKYVDTDINKMFDRSFTSCISIYQHPRFVDSLTIYIEMIDAFEREWRGFQANPVTLPELRTVSKRYKEMEKTIRSIRKDYNQWEKDN